MKVKSDETTRATIKVAEAAKIAGVGDRAIRIGIKEGRIPHKLFGRNIVIPRASFMRWLEDSGSTRTA